MEQHIITLYIAYNETTREIERASTDKLDISTYCHGDYNDCIMHEVDVTIGLSV